jgi:transcriptional regulator with XRE-family HTH domain
MSRKLSDKKTPLSEWLGRNEDKISRKEFAAKVGVNRGHLDRYAHGGRKPGLDLAFDIEDATSSITAGADVLKARLWKDWVPSLQSEPPLKPTKKSRLSTKDKSR